MYKHHHDEILIEEEGPIPRCNKCDIFVPHSALSNQHDHTFLCKQGTELKHKRGVAEETQPAKQVIFIDKGIPLERVLSLKYLGRQTAAADDDWPALYLNLKNTQKRWGMVSRILSWDGASKRISGIFYKLISQSVLLYDCETWVVTPSMLCRLDTFHKRIVHRLTGRAPIHQGDGHWSTPHWETQWKKLGSKKSQNIFQDDEIT
jgi:hypothetical protein